MRNKNFRHATLALSALLAVSLLAGCSANFSLDPHQSAQSATGEIGDIAGSLHGGQAPISGAHVYLYAASTTAYAGASTSLLQAAANTTADASGNYYTVTDGGGNFSVGGDYQCTVGTQVYLVAIGGNPGLGTGTNNTAIVQMAGLGQCPAAGNLAAQVPYVVINEVSTVVFAYVMSGYGTDALHIGSSGSPLALKGIANAMANVPNIIGVAYGQAMTTTASNANSTVPQSKIYALANAVAACVNTASPAGTCTTLFGYANSTGATGGTAAADEAQALFNIAHHPTYQVSNIFGLGSTSPPFSPHLTTAPADWTMPIVYNNVVSTRPGNIAFDSLGDAWISDRNNAAVVKMSPQGAVTTLTNLNNGGSNGSIYQVAVDSGDNVWALDEGNSQIYRFNTAGQWESTITGNQLSNPVAISFNSLGNALVLNEGNNSISIFSASGIAQLPATYGQTGTGSLGSPLSIAVDLTGNAFIPANGGGSAVGVLANNSTAAITYTDFSGTAGNATAIAIDGLNNPWQAQGNTIVENPTYASGSYQLYECLGFIPEYEFNVTGNFLGCPTASRTPTSITTGGLNQPISLAFDGNGYLWAANSGASTVSGFNGTTRLAASGFPTGGSGVAYAAAPDGSGNLWTANSDGTVTQILGLATPTVTPVYPGVFGKKP